MNRIHTIYLLLVSVAFEDRVCTHPSRVGVGRGHDNEGNLGDRAGAAGCKNTETPNSEWDVEFIMDGTTDGWVDRQEEAEAIAVGD